MTLSNAPSREVKNGNGSATTFSFNFVINKSDDLEVVLKDALGAETVLTEGTGTSNYAVNIISYPNNGSITYPAALGTELQSGETLTLRRIVDVIQETDLINQGPYKPEQVEATFDLSRMIDQQLTEELNRSIKTSVTDTSGADFTLPDPEADRVIAAWNGAGDALVIGPTVNEISNAQGYAQAASDSADASAASASAASASASASATSASNAAASEAAAQAAANGMKWKASSRAATTANITLSGAQTVDGVALVADDICLVKNQTASEENGMYVVAAGAWTRHPQMDEWDEVPSAATAVEEGTVNADLQFICLSDQGGTLGTTAITWGTLGSPTTADEVTLTKSGTEISIKDNGATLDKLDDTGTDGYVLTAKGAGVDPEWQVGGKKILQRGSSIYNTSENINATVTSRGETETVTPLSSTSILRITANASLRAANSSGGNAQAFAHMGYYDGTAWQTFGSPKSAYIFFRSDAVEQQARVEVPVSSTIELTQSELRSDTSVWNFSWIAYEIDGSDGLLRNVEFAWEEIEV